MLQRMEEYTLERCTIEKNDMMEDIKIWKEIGTILAAISVATGNIQETNQILRISSTHNAITQSDVKIGDRFGGYNVDYCIPGRRYNRLLLSREDGVR